MAVIASFQLFQSVDGFSGVAGDAGRVPEVDAAFVEPIGEFFKVGKRKVLHI